MIEVTKQWSPMAEGLASALEVTTTDMSFNETVVWLGEVEVVNLTVQLLASMKDKSTMQNSLEHALEVLSKELRGSNG